MSKISKLIDDLCPNGVEFKRLKDVVEKVKCKGVLASELKNILVENGDIKLLSTGKFNGYTTSELAGKNICNGEVITLPTGGNADIKYHNGKFVNSGNHIFTASTTNVKYIYYFLLNNVEYIQSCFRGSAVQHPEMNAIMNILIPIPPPANTK
jgi:type I restriction enzyme S subunit